MLKESLRFGCFGSLDEIILPTPLESLKCASEDVGNINFRKYYKFEAYKCAVEGMALTHPKLLWQIPLKVYGNNFFPGSSIWKHCVSFLTKGTDKGKSYKMLKALGVFSYQLKE